MRERENNYDLLRIICTVAVISIHVSANYMTASTETYVLGELYDKNMLVTLLYNVLPRFAVPCFVMLSGAFILCDVKNAEYKYFYRKSFRLIGIQTFLFSVFYVLYSLAGILLNGRRHEILIPFKEWIKGEPCYHMWYLYMLLGVYLLVPVIIRWKESVEIKCFKRVACIFTVFASLSVWTSQHLFMWDLGFSFCYIGYLMLGYIVRERMQYRKNNIVGVFLILIGVTVEGIVAALRYKQIEIPYALTDPYCPLILIASVLIFVGFSKITVKIRLQKLSSLTFPIYLIHAFIWDIGFRVIRVDFDNRIVMPISVILIFFISLILAQVYMMMWTYIDKKLRVSEKLCRVIHLE